MLALVIILCAIHPATAQDVFTDSGESTSYTLDYGRFTSDSDQKTSSSYVLLDSVSDIQVEGDSASYQLRNVYAGPAATCGNGIIETGESCEGSNFQGLTCNSFGFELGNLQCVNCQIITTQCFNPETGGGGSSWFCGNGIREAGEQCDDGNIFSGDGCSAGCMLEYPDCGNGIKDIGEQCDDGNVNYGDGCTPLCELEGEEEPEEEEPEVPVKPSAPEFVFEPGFDPSIIYPFLKEEPSLPVVPTKPTKPGEPEEPLKPSAPEYYDYHFDHFKVGDTITVLDETVFVATSAPANEFYELVILDKENKIVVRQGVQSSPEGILMAESIPFLNYEEYSVLLVDTKQEIFKGWNILIEDRKYRIHDNLVVNNQTNREFIALGTFKYLEKISGNGKTETDYYAYLQKVEKVKGKTASITFIKTKADKDGNYTIELPEKLKNGSYIMHVVQVYEDGKVSRNKRYVFDVESGRRFPPIWIIITIILATVFGRFKDIKNFLKKHTGKSANKWQIRSLIWFMSLVTLSTAVIPAQAIQTTPNVFVYEGKLLNNVGLPIQTAQTFRLSLWSSDDMVAGDVDALGAINPFAVNYGGWYETHTVTPNADGTFFLELGSINPLPDMDFSIHKHLMVEVKADGALDTSYELMDPTGDNGADADDRQTIGSTPFTNNADFIDNAEIGTSFGDIVTLDTGDVWNIATIPGGTNTDEFVIDYDDTAVAGDVIELTFGNSLNESIGFDISNDWFTVSNDINLNQNEIKDFAVDNLAIAPSNPVPGQMYYNTTLNDTYIWNGTGWDDMTTTGDDDLDTVYENDGDKIMNVFDVRGLSFNVDTSGDFLVDLQSTGDLVIADDGDEFAVFTDDGLFGIGNTDPETVLHVDSNELNTEPIITMENTGGDVQFFRIDENPETTITASVGDLAVDSTNGTAYIKSTGDATDTGWVQLGGLEGKQAVFQVEYANATVEGDGTNNKGLLQSYFADEGGAEKHNYYEWTTRRDGMQDIDIVLSYILPPDFIEFTANPLSILYQTSSIFNTVSKVDITLYDTNGIAVPLTGATSLANTNWTTQDLTFAGSPTFNAGEVITLIIKLSATKIGYSRVSDVIFNYNGS